MKFIIILFYISFILGCSQGNNPTTRLPSEKGNVIPMNNNGEKSDYFLELIRLKDGAKIYSPVSCDNSRCLSLFSSVALENDIDPSSLLYDKESLTDQKRVLKGSSPRVKKTTDSPINIPDIKTQNLSYKKPTVKPSSDDFKSFEGIVKERKKSLGETNKQDKSFSSIAEKNDFRLIFTNNLNKFKVKKIKDNKIVQIKNIEKDLGLTGNNEGFRRTQTDLGEAHAVVTQSKDSIQYERSLSRQKTNDPDFSKNKSKVFDGLEEHLTKLSSDIDTNLKNSGENASYVLAFRTARSAQFKQISQAKNVDGTFKYPRPLRLEAEAQLSPSATKKTHSNELNKTLTTIPITLMLRKVSDQGFMAFVLGRPSKRLQLKAKSDNLGNIPIDQVFTHKVKGQGEQLTLNRAVFNEFSFQSRAEILTDGLPNSFNKRYVRRIKLSDGSELVQVGLKKKTALPDDPIEWKIRSEADFLLKKSPDQYATYEVHADPRAMKGSSEILLKEWKTMRVDSGVLKPPAEGFTHLKNTDWEVPGGFEKAKNTIEGQSLRRNENLTYAERANLDYAEFLLRKEAVDPSVNPQLAKADLYGDKVTQFLGGPTLIKKASQERLNTAGSIAPDIDLLTVGTKVKSGFDNTVEVNSSIGRTDLVTRNLLDQTGTQAENIFVQKAIHHGAEVENYEFPQNLKDDYPIGVVSTDGSATRIPKSLGRHPHENLFIYLRKHSEVDTSINPAYVVKNKSEFPKDLSKWPTAQIKRMKVYRKWVEDGVKKGGDKKPFFEKAKQEVDDFNVIFPITYRWPSKSASNDSDWYGSMNYRYGSKQGVFTEPLASRTLPIS